MHLTFNNYDYWSFPSINTGNSIFNMTSHSHNEIDTLAFCKLCSVCILEPNIKTNPFPFSKPIKKKIKSYRQLVLFCCSFSYFAEFLKPWINHPFSSTYIFCFHAVFPPAVFTESGRSFRWDQPFRDGQYELVSLPLHQLSLLNDAFFRSSQIQAIDHLREDFCCLFKFRLKKKDDICM